MMEDVGKLKPSLRGNFVLSQQIEEASLLGRDRRWNQLQIAPLSAEGILYGWKHLPFSSIQAFVCWKVGRF